MRGADPRDVARRMNAMRPGECITLGRHEIADLRGSPYDSGLGVLVDNLVGSAYPECWTISENPQTGSMTFKRHDF